MKIAPLKVTDPWYGKVVNNAKINATALNAVPIEGVVEMELVELLHGGPESNYRPYLHLRGEMVQVAPTVELPYGVTELPMRQGNGVAIDAFYDFNHEQLATLVTKGYFTEAFTVPEGLTQDQWVLPGAADFLVVAPVLADDAPIVFMSIHSQSNLALDEASSGYELAAYFPDVSAEAQAEAQADTAAPQRSAEVNDMFHDVEFEQFQPIAEYVAPEQSLQDARGTVPDGVFSRLVAEIIAEQPVVEEIVEEPSEEVEESAAGSMWDLYMQKVAPSVERTLAGEVGLDDDEPEADAAADVDTEAEPAIEADEDLRSTTTPEGFIDFTADEPEVDLVPLSQQLEDSGADHEDAAARRAARIRSQLSFDDQSAATDETQPNL